MKRTVMFLAAAGCVCLAPIADAHHSHPAFYDFCKRVTVEGRIDSVEWTNPHTQIRITLDDGRAYRVEWMSLGAIERQPPAGSAERALTFGARIVVTGNPQRDPEEIRARFPNVSVSTNPPAIDPLQIRRVDDSWSWALPRSPNPLPCTP